MSSLSVDLFPFSWEPLSEPTMLRLSSIFAKWKGTRYMPGVQSAGQGVDCVRFVCAVLDELLEIKTPIRTLPQDTSFHQRDKAQAAVRKIMRLYEPTVSVERGCPARPGDVVIVGCSGGGPGHALVVGTEPQTLWQSDSPSGVSKGGFGLISTYQRLHRVYRLSRIS